MRLIHRVGLATPGITAAMSDPQPSQMFGAARLKASLLCIYSINDNLSLFW